MSTEARQGAGGGLHLKLEGISKAFDDAVVLDDLDFDEIVTALAVIGPSGGGKSTLLRIIGGLIDPTSGSMEVDGRKVAFNESSLLEYRKRIGFVFQDGGLFHHLSALQNIVVPLEAVHGMGHEEAMDVAGALLSRLGLADDMGKLPSQMSGGQKQRVAIARAIAPNPELLLLDEPTSALDPEFTNEILNILSGLKDAGTRFIIVTHEMGFARHACDEVAFLYNGKLLEHGKSDHVFSDPESPELKRFLDRLLEWRV